MTNDDGSYIRGLTDDELERDKRCLALARRLREKQCGNDEILSRLRETGYSRISCMKAFKEIDGISLQDAKFLVLESSAWSDSQLPDNADVLAELEKFDDDAE